MQRQSLPGPGVKGKIENQKSFKCVLSTSQKDSSVSKSISFITVPFVYNILQVLKSTQYSAITYWVEISE